MKRGLQNVISVLFGYLLAANLFQFVYLFLDYGWRGIPFFLSLGFLAWVTFLKGIASCLLLLLCVIACFLRDQVAPAVEGVHDGA